MKKNIWIFNHYANTPENGTITRHYYFSKQLVKLGYDVKVFTSSAIHNTNLNEVNDGSAFKEKIIDGISFIFVNTRNYSGNSFTRVLNMLDFYNGLKKVSKNFDKPTLIYSSSPHPLALYAGLKIGKKLGVPSICEVRDLWPAAITAYSKLTDRNILIKMLYAFEKTIYQKADALIFTMPGYWDYFNDKGLDGIMQKEKTFYINNGIDLDEYEFNKQKYPCLDTDMNDKSTFKLLYTGSLRTVNDPFFLVKLGKVFKNKGIDNVKIIVYGLGDIDALKEACKKEGIDNLIFKGFVPKYKLPAIAENADVFINYWKSTFLEKYGFSSNKSFDYLAAGKSILSMVPSKYDFYDNYNCAISVDPNKPEEVADAVLQIMNMSKEEKARQEENCRLAVDDFEFKKLTNDLIKVFDYACDNYK